MDDSDYGSQDARGHWPHLYNLVLKVHRRLLEANYADGTISLDKWFGFFHDGSPESDNALNARCLKLSKLRLKEAL